VWKEMYPSQIDPEEAKGSQMKDKLYNSTWRRSRGSNCSSTWRSSTKVQQYKKDKQKEASTAVHEEGAVQPYMKESQKEARERGSRGVRGGRGPDLRFGGGGAPLAVCGEVGKEHEGCTHYGLEACPPALGQDLTQGFRQRSAQLQRGQLRAVPAPLPLRQRPLQLPPQHPPEQATPAVRRREEAHRMCQGVTQNLSNKWPGRDAVQ
jgi:hypothetical protein